MASKSLDKIKAGLKLRTESKEGALTFRMGVKKHVLPFEARTIQSDEYVFLHIPPAAEIFKITKEGLVVVDDADEAAKAQQSFRRRRRGKGRRGASAASVEVPKELEEALKKTIPAGYKLGFNPDGSPKLVKMRKRRKSS